jgi:crossover junction endodeoxyribonuclease RusA
MIEYAETRGDRVLIFHASGVPQPQGSMKGFRRGNRVIVTSDNERLRPWRTAVEFAAVDAMPHFGHSGLFHGPVTITLTFRLPVPQSAPKRKRLSATKRPDLDKLVRGVLDALTGVVWADDAQVVRLVAEKELAYDDVPGVSVVVTEPL